MGKKKRGRIGGRLDSLDLTLCFESKDEYEARLRAVQLDLLKLQQVIREKNVPVLLATEGWDAAGKGGAIKRLTERLDPRGFHVIPVGAPNQVEMAHHYLWRFWTQLPSRGRILIFDRSWYGRVLVERVENLCLEKAWKRAYEEINDFERTLVDAGTVLCKFWLHISKKEQLKRFREREKNPFKRWKITENDWRNRRRWDSYQKAAEEMFEKTSTEYSPWILVEAEHKWYARVKVADTVAAAIHRVLD
jgi:polyphosphate kinase 2 (PPK2 family)